MPHRPSLTKGLLAGLAAGLAATLVMDQFLNLLATARKAAEKQKKLAEGDSLSQIAQEQKQQEEKQQNSEGSTEIVARKIAEATGNTLPKESRKSAGEAVHYTFGTLMGVVYATTSEWLPELTSSGGTAFGTLLFLSADEIAVPMLHLSAPPTETPASDQLQHWAAHVVYGATLELTRNLVRRLF